MDYRRVTHAVAGLLELATEDVTSDLLLGRLCGAAIDLLEIDGAGVMLVDTETHTNRFAFAISEAATDLEKVQEAMRFGPCRDAADSGVRVLAHDDAEMQQWPRFAQVAASFGITAAAAIPLLSRGRCWGVLDLYRSTSQPWDDEALDVAQLLADGATAHLVISADRQAARLAQVQLRHHSTHDSLTGLPNRVELFDRLASLLERSAMDGSAVAAAFVDLDDFGHVNTVHGHRAGDRVLREVGLRLAAACGPGDFAARLADDTFVVVLSGVDSGDEDTERAGRRRATALQVAIAEPIELEAGNVTLRAHVGAAIASPTMSAEELVDEADDALYASLQQRYPTVCILDHSIHGSSSGHGPTAGLREALDDEALSVHYQPIVTAASPHNVVAVEALMRWRDQDGTLIPARSFVDAAARNGLMPAFGSWLVDRACAQLAEWRKTFGDRSPRHVFVNLSARELNDPTTPGMLAAALRRHGLVAGDLGLEIVEEGFVHRGLVHRLHELRERGHRLAMDDFGTGHSSLSRLLDLELDVVKLERALVAELARDARRVEFMRAVVALTRSLDVQVVAEGVETVEQRDHLIAAGVDRLQGYLFGRPVSADDLTVLLADVGPAVLLRHVIAGEAAVVRTGSVRAVFSRWFPDPTADVSRALDDLEHALATRGSTRAAENYLGVEISHTL